MEMKHALIIYVIAIVFALLIYLFFFASKGTQKPKPTTTTTTTSSASLTPQPNQAWLPVVGYSQSFETCKNFCIEYQKNSCSSSTAKQYCDITISIDLSKDGVISQNSQGLTPLGRRTCETFMRCFDVIAECKCSKNVLNMNACMIFYLEEMKQTSTNIQDYLAPGCTVSSV